MEDIYMSNVFYVKDFVREGISDSTAIANCFLSANAVKPRTIVFDGRDYMIDEAIVLESDTHVIIDDCEIMQNDRVFDNVFRGSNVIVDPKEPNGYPLDVLDIENVKIEGRGNARITGTKVPRVGYHPGKNNYQRMNGDFWGWRTMMICFANGKGIEISGLSLTHTMCWAVTFEFCEEVYVHDLYIDARVKNGDGIDFRSGCHHCRVENISGYTADDTVACTALAKGARYTYPNKKSVYPMSVTGGLTRGRSCDIHDVEIKGIKTGGMCHAIICLAACGNQVYNINISDVDEAPTGGRAATVSIYTGYGDGYNPGDLHDIYIDGVHATQARAAVEIRADVKNVQVKNIVNDDNSGLEMCTNPKYKHHTPYKIGISTSGCPVEELDSEYFAAFKNANVSFIELSAKRDEAFKYDFKMLSDLSYEYNVAINSLHLPFMPFEEIDISKPDLADATVERLSELMRRANRDAAITKFVIHPSGEPIADEERAERMECAKNSLKKLADLACELGAEIAVENLPRTCLGKNSAEMLELLSAHPFLRACFDTNHLLSESHEDFVRAVGGKIITTHVSDYDFVDERHVLPGEGSVDWKKVIDSLIAAEYAGNWIYELGFGSTKHIERERDLTPADFVDNAAAIFNGEAPKLLKARYIFKEK